MQRSRTEGSGSTNAMLGGLPAQVQAELQRQRSNTTDGNNVQSNPNAQNGVQDLQALQQQQQQMLNRTASMGSNFSAASMGSSQRAFPRARPTSAGPCLQVFGPLSTRPGSAGREGSVNGGLCRGGPRGDALMLTY